MNSGDLLVIRGGSVWQTATGPCVCVAECDGSPECSGQMALGGGSGTASSSLAASGLGASLTQAGATLEVQPLGGGQALTTLAPNTTYELHYVADEPVNLYVLFAVASSIEEGATGIAAPATGPWGGTGSFVNEDWSQATPLIAAPGYAGMYQLAAIADTLDGSTPPADSGHLLNFTTGSVGTLAFEAYLSSIDATSGDWVDMPTTAVLSVK